MMRFFKAVAVFLAFVGVGIVSAAAVIALLFRQEEVRVPDLTGQDIVSVIETVRQLGLQLKVDRREPHPTLPRDTVISQTPAGGNGIKKGRQIRVVVSQGPSDLLAPKLIGEHFRKADIMIRQAGFLTGDISRAYSDTVERDIVIAQDPRFGSPLDKGAPVNLLVSAGKRPDLYVMPRLSGKRVEDALSIIDRMGLQYRVITRSTGTRQTGGRAVTGQKPAAGYPVAADATVDIVVSK